MLLPYWQKWLGGSVGLGLWLSVGAIAPSTLAQSAAPANSDICPAPALARLIRHRVAQGETLEGIARQYNLIPATIMGFNPATRSGKVAVGSDLVIPPYNGIRVEVPAGTSWKEIATTYKVRADVLFEVNGCQSKPRVVFVPGVNWSPVQGQGQYSARPSGPSAMPPNLLPRYPLPATTTILLGYGWQLDPTLGQVVFHSGLDLAAAPGTRVLAAGNGTVAFAGTQGAYGNLVVVNHPGGRQTRYAQLATIRVKTNQTVRQGDLLGTVGATGTPSSAASHLHFEVRINSALGWVAEDPGFYFKQMNRR